MQNGGITLYNVSIGNVKIFIWMNFTMIFHLLEYPLCTHTRGV